MLLAFAGARAVVLADPLSAERYAVDGARRGLVIRLRIARNYKGPFQVGEIITVEAFDYCLEPARPTRRLLYFLCGGDGTTTGYCNRSMDWRTEVPGDRAILDRIVDPPLQEIRVDPRRSRAPGPVP